MSTSSVLEEPHFSGLMDSIVSSPAVSLGRLHNESAAIMAHLLNSLMLAEKTFAGFGFSISSDLLKRRSPL